jgi:hypothetical protein
MPRMLVNLARQSPTEATENCAPPERVLGERINRAGMWLQDCVDVTGRT